MEAPADTEAVDAAERPAKKPRQKYDKPKPWDTDDIDHWRVDAFTKDDNPSGMLEESSFACLFPKYREKYLREVWPAVTKALKEQGIGCELNLVEGSMTVRTTRKTYDPYVIMKARDLIKLLARSVPAPQALKILNDDMQCDVIKIGGLIRNKEKFVKRRQRLIGSNNVTLKALEMLTQCYVFVQGGTVCAMGPWKGLKTVRKVVEDCIHNVHPIHHIKILMIKRQLAQDPALAGESWDRFLPQYKKKNSKRKKPAKPDVKKVYTPFPPPQQPSKVDLQIESGEYFLSQEAKRAKAESAIEERQRAKAEANKQRRLDGFVAPAEDDRKGGAEEQVAGSELPSTELRAMAEKLKAKGGAGRGRGAAAEDEGIQKYLSGGAAVEGGSPGKRKQRSEDSAGDGSVKLRKQGKKEKKEKKDKKDKKDRKGEKRRREG